MATERLGPYRIGEVLGQGGMGVVYRGVDERDGTAVAIKTVFSVEQTFLSSIRREVEVLARIRHPGIVRILDNGVHDGTPWYAMELLEGHTLRDLMRSHSPPGGESSGEAAAITVPERGHVERGHVERDPSPSPVLARSSLPLKSALDLVRRICEPLAFLHGEGVVHRDLKPSNIFLRDMTDPVLVDFGLVQRFGGPSSARESLRHGEGPPAGTYLYMAPEQLGDGVVDPRTDLYALGCILYQLVTGRAPFRGTGPQLALQHLRTTPPPPSSLVAGLPESIDALLARLLAKEPARRIGYAADLAAALEGMVGDSPGPSREAPPAREYLYRPALVGRRRFVADMLDDLEAGRHPVVLLRGPSGVGKTRVAVELARGARLRDFRVSMGACEPLSGAEGDRGTGAPLHAFRPVLRDIGDHCRSRGAAEARRILGSRAAALALYEPSLRDIDGLGVQSPPWLPSTEASRLRLYDWLAQTLIAFARDAPLLLLIDDVQWADELTRELLVSIGERATPLPGVSVLCTSREGSATTRALLGSSGVRDARLGPLEDGEIAELVGEMIARPTPPEALVARVGEIARGNPFHVSEYLHAAVDCGVLRRDAHGRWVVEEGATEHLPASLQELVAARIDMYGPAARELLELVAAFGTEVSTELLRRTSTLEESDLLALTGELIARDLLVESSAGAHRLTHDQLRGTVYGRIAEGRRRDLHERIARAMEASAPADPRQLATHWDRAGRPEQAAPRYLEAAVEAQRMAASAQARELFERGFALERQAGLPVEASASRCEMEVAYADALYGTGRLDDARRVLESVLSSLGVSIPGGRAGWAARLAREGLAQAIPWSRGRGSSAEAQRLALRALDTLASVLLGQADTLGQLGVALIGGNLAEAAVEGPEAAMGHARMALAVGLAGWDRAAERYFARARRAVDVGGEPLPPRALMSMALVCLVRGRWDRLAEISGPAIATCREAGDVQSEAQIRLFVAGAELVRGRPGPCLDAIDEALATLPPHGFELERTHLQCDRAAALVHRRDTAGARAALEAVDRLLELGGDPVAQVLRATLSAAVALVEGDGGLARREADRALARLRDEPRGSPGYLVPLLFLPGIYCALPDDGGRARARECLGRLKRQAWLQPAGRPALALYEGILARVEGRRRRAVRRLEEAVRRAEEAGVPWVEGVARWELAALGVEDAGVQRSRARALLEGAGCRLPPFHAGGDTRAPEEEGP